MTTIKKQLETRNVTVEIEQRESNKGSETESIQIWIRDNKTKKVLKNLAVMDSKDLKVVWLSNNDVLKQT